MLEFSDEEVAEARRVNRRLEWMPRFRAPMPWDRLLVQTMIAATQHVMPRHDRTVTISTRAIDHRGVRVRLRVLKPQGRSHGVYVDYHGGGWSVGNARMDDPVNLRIAQRCGMTVVSVDYGLMPRVSLQRIIAECTAAADWVFSHGEREFGARDVFMGGESAGAHLAACAALGLKGSRADFDRLKGIVLFYGAFDLTATPSARRAGPDSLVLHGPSLREGLQKLTPGLTDAERRSPELSPLYADLTGMPPAIILVGTLDPLLDDSRMLAERWREQGGEAELVVAPEAPHAFNRLMTRMARRTNAHVRRWLQERLAARAEPAAAE
ncbi:alpha/beta hydrolase [Lutibaculum baratangense]|uniref:Putative esterase n=1 Tax=Lutibaculum baratangense AMV1 TaxID=631454 RepID=V4RSZ9_9HYPH|nr:alpha/beta hydrolase fold domain-containing protein [Lutibaculum baratangense]ESR26255.1 putative esterase [Lutibaculum baratangense AMV1]